MRNLFARARSLLSARNTAAPGLPMTKPARMSRAASLGFHPATHYHGTASHFTAFDLKVGGAVSGSSAGRSAIFVTQDRQVAQEFAKLAAGKGGGTGHVMPLRVRTGRVAGITLTGSERNNEISATLASAFSGGYGAVVLRNYTTPGGLTGRTVLAVAQPSQLRFTAAAFDPKKINSPHLMAGIAGGVVVLGTAGRPAPASAAPSPSSASRGSATEASRRAARSIVMTRATAQASPGSGTGRVAPYVRVRNGRVENVSGYAVAR